MSGRFHGTSPYHKKNPLTFLFQTDSTINPMRFTFKFPFKFSDSGAGDAQVFTPQGHFPAAMELTVNGPCSNIYFKAEDNATGELIGALDLSGVSVAAGTAYIIPPAKRRRGVESEREHTH